MPRRLTPCPEHGCPTLTTGGRCDEHARPPWAGSTRSARLPSNWGFIRRKVLRRDTYICHVCGRTGADEVDHLEAGDNHALTNLAAIHRSCHAKKSAAEGHAARRGKAPQ
jgi:5-methylcytosine-specific restriction endonuclease McrA